MIVSKIWKFLLLFENVGFFMIRVQCEGFYKENFILKKSYGCLDCWKNCKIYIILVWFTVLSRSACVSFQHVTFVHRTFEFPIPVVVLQNDTNKSCLVFIKSEKYAFFWVTLWPLLRVHEVKWSWDMYITILSKVKLGHVYWN